MTWRTLSALLLFGCAVVACTETDSGNPPVLDFATSGCKTNSEKARPGQSSDVTAGFENELYDGLTCLVWSRPTEDTLHVDITNYATGCFVDKGWSPRARRTGDGALELVLKDDECAVAACGSCLYDLSFQIEIDNEADLPVRVFQEGCEDQTPSPTAVLPLSSQMSGAICAYLQSGALQWHASTKGTIGQRNMPCSHEGDGGVTSTSCVNGLACTELEAGHQLCLASCQTDANCDSLTRCEAGVCKLSTTGLTLTP